MKNRVENTTRTVRDNPLAALFGGLGAPGGIEASEARGQAQLVASAVMPTRILRGNDEQFIALGFTFGAPVEGDELFRDATLPAGWKKEGSDHAMWSYVVDERGIKRVAVFYKAAFYDRHAHMSLSNVGREVGSSALYGDATPTAESLKLALLTPAERADLLTSLDDMRQRLKESPDIYADRAANLATCDAILAANP